MLTCLLQMDLLVDSKGVGLGEGFVTGRTFVGTLASMHLIKKDYSYSGHAWRNKYLLVSSVWIYPIHVSSFNSNQDISFDSRSVTSNF